MQGAHCSIYLHLISIGGKHAKTDKTLVPPVQQVIIPTADQGLSSYVHLNV